MTDAEIKKALECCATDTCFTNSCPFEDESDGFDISKCTSLLSRIALDLINRQQAEIERLKDENLQSEYSARIRVDDFFVCANSLGEWLEFCDSLKAEAIKEFAERLKKHIESLEYNANTPRKTITVQMLYDQINWVLKEVILKTIDGALKEMVGDAE